MIAQPTLPLPSPTDLSSLCRVLTEHAPLPTASLEGETHIVRYANPAFCGLMNKSLEQLVGKSFYELVPEKDQCLTLLDCVFRTGKAASQTEEEPLRPHSAFCSYTSWPVLMNEQIVGLMIQVSETAEVHAKTVAMNQSLMLGAIRQHELVEAVELANAQLLREIAARQVTERELAEKARLLDLTDDAIIVRDFNDQITLWNKGAENLFGWSAGEVIGKHMHTVLHTEFPKPMEEILVQLYQEGFFMGEVTQIDRDGRRVQSLCRWVLDQGTESILTSHTDITERKKTEQALRESEERYRNLFNSMDEGFCVIDMIFDEKGLPIDYRFLEVNPSFERQSGLSNVAGKRMLELAPDHEAHWFEVYGKVALTGEPIRYVNVSKAWGDRWFDAYAFRLGGSESHKVAVLFKDITEQKESELALRSAQVKLSEHAIDLEREVTERTTMLRDSVRSLESLTYTMAHDLRAPIRAMKAFTAALMEDVPLDKTGKNYALRIHRAAGRMDQLVNDLLDYGQLTHLEFPLHFFDLKAEIERVMALFGKEIQNANAEVRVSGPMPVIIGNKILTEQIVSNLLLNALKFINVGVVPQIHFTAETRGSMVRLWVKDNGIGIAPRYHENIFGVFQRLHTTDEYSGTGVGLAIVKRAAERMNGTAGVESEAGQGSRFWIDLPIAPQAVG